MTVLDSSLRHRLVEVARLIEQDKGEHFDMSHFFVTDGMGGGDIAHGGVRECGTAGCIAGWIISEFSPPGLVFDPDLGQSYEDRALELLGITDFDTTLARGFDRLFTDAAWWRRRGLIGDAEYLDDVTAPIAVIALRQLANGTLDITSTHNY